VENKTATNNEHGNNTRHGQRSIQHPIEIQCGQVSACSVFQPDHGNMDEGHQSRVLSFVANAHGQDRTSTPTKIGCDGNGTHGPKPQESTINKITIETNAR
jgi:hypothetical protein